MKRLIAISTIFFAAAAFAQSGGPYDLSWSTIDGGGQMFSTGGSYSLGGTIGQHDASSFDMPISGGTYSLVGGFWPAAVPSCACLGDMNGDGLRNGNDIQMFVACLVAQSSCLCADVDGLSGVDPDDIAPFIISILTTTPCP